VKQVLPRKSINQLVINWHVNEICNFQCTYCYAHWDKDGRPKDLIRDQAQTELFLTDLYEFFRPRLGPHPSIHNLNWQEIRLNIAGGEPLLYRPEVLRTIEFAARLGFKVSIITNGFYLDGPTLSAMAPRLDWLGISIDSVLPETNKLIGRLDRRNRLLDLAELENDLVKARSDNFKLKLKLNTVINKFNWSEDMSKMVGTLDPEKWKIFKVLPILTDKMSVSNEEYRSFIKRHEHLSSIMSIEDNEKMIESYIMLDPQGRFFQNRNLNSKHGYNYSRPILDCGVKSGFETVNFCADKFTSRYSNSKEVA